MMQFSNIKNRNKIIIAIDTKDINHALKLVKEIPDAGAFKLGLEFFCSNGIEGVEKIADTGARIFLDLKFHDIPNTVKEALRSTLYIDPFMMTLHISGGKNMLSSSVKMVKETYDEKSSKRPLIVGVSVLTSIIEEDLKTMGITGKVEQHVKRLADLAFESGMDGIVCSAKELKYLKSSFNDRFLFVTPGIRTNWNKKHDQKRIMTPSQAIRLGADFLVIGRPITEASDPLEAFNKICSEI